MTGQELIDLIKKNELEDFEIVIRTSQKDDSSYGLTVSRYDIIGIADIGYSDKVASLELE